MAGFTFYCLLAQLFLLSRFFLLWFGGQFTFPQRWLHCRAIARAMPLVAMAYEVFMISVYLVALYSSRIDLQSSRSILSTASPPEQFKSGRSQHCLFWLFKRARMIAGSRASVTSVPVSCSLQLPQVCRCVVGLLEKAEGESGVLVSIRDGYGLASTYIPRDSRFNDIPYST